MTTQILPALVRQFQSQHSGKLPESIVLTPEALAALAVKKEVVTRSEGVPVVCEPFEVKDIAAPGTGTRLGVLIVAGEDCALRGCELA